MKQNDLGRQETAIFSVADAIDSPISFNLIGGQMTPKKWKHNWYKNNRETVIKKSKEWYLKNRKRALLTRKLWKRNNPNKVKSLKYKQQAKNRQLQRRHGITLEYFNNLLKIQNNECAICGNKFRNNKDTCVDHDHNTGKIRQLLCFNCNIGIGKFRDSIVLVEKALSYLHKWL